MKFELTAKILLFVLATVFIGESLFSQNRNYTSQRTTVTPIIDGFIDEEVWDVAEWGGDFFQHFPQNGVAPTYQTQFKILYDDNNLYVAIRMFDEEPEKIVKRLSRRDINEGDWISIGFDSYNDNLTSYNFGVNAVGVKRDLVTVNDNQRDFSWDAVYYVKVSIDDKGWVAEFRIPLSQLRFADVETHNWGMQIVRNVFRLDERSSWQNIPRDAKGWVSNWGNLNGIHGIKPKLDLEIVPYTVIKSDNYKPETGNPYMDGNDFSLSAGLDGKVSLSNEFTLNFTINPDFGQVEADPSEVNLTAFETFFEEKRPFFIEGKNIFSFPLSAGGGAFRNQNIFYSRRIGRTPHLSDGDYSLADNEYANMPEYANILAAFKFSGKTKNGLSVGIMESIVPKAQVEISDNIDTRKQVVEPFTNYFLARVQKDYNQGNTTLGGMFSATNRDLTNDELNILPKGEYTGGLDFKHFWKDQTFLVQANGFASRIIGSENAIINLQESSTRYYQRPDVNHVSLDTTLTSLSGYGGGFKIGKVGNGHWRYSFILNFRSPGFDPNGLGYIQNADEIQNINYLSYQVLEPKGIFISLRMVSALWNSWSFDWIRNATGIEFNMHSMFKNHWRLDWGVNKSSQYRNRFELQGGPALMLPGGGHGWMVLNTDNRKKLSFNLHTFQDFGRYSSKRSQHYTFGINYRASTALSFSINNSFVENKNELKYIETVDHNGENIFVVGHMRSKQFSSSIRINYSITPDLTIQYYGQPFIFAADYSKFKRITNSTADNYYERFHEYTPNEINLEEGEYVVNESGIQGEYRFADPKFNFFQFRSNFVVRWEYLPGSTLYFVWSQGRTDDNGVGEYNFSNDMNTLFDIYPSNVFLLKFSYRIVI